ncbi:MAG: hypothetical protein ACLQNE_15140 [Thermoguttaceae bacterium]|jgi:hypothetical protein
MYNPDRYVDKRLVSPAVAILLLTVVGPATDFSKLRFGLQPDLTIGLVVSTIGGGAAMAMMFTRHRLIGMACGALACPWGFLLLYHCIRISKLPVLAAILPPAVLYAMVGAIYRVLGGIQPDD